MTQGTADKFIHGDLYGLVPITIMSAPNGAFLRTVPANKYAGTIFSWVVNNGVVWWHVQDRDTLATIGFIQHAENKFNKQKLENSLQKWEENRQLEIDTAADKRIKENKSLDFFGNLEGMVSTITIVLILLIVFTILRK